MITIKTSTSEEYNPAELSSVWHALPVLRVNGTVVDGNIAQRIETAEVNNAYYQFPAIFIWKLYNNMAYESELKAEKFLPEFRREIIKPRELKSPAVYAIKTSGKYELLEYFKSLISAYLISFGALENYINTLLDTFEINTNDFDLPKCLIKEKNSESSKYKLDVIKECSLEEKIFHLLPYHYKLRGIYLNLSKYKSDFMKILKVRNELTHPKRKTIRTGFAKGKYYTSKVWNNLLPIFKNEKATLSFHPSKFVCNFIKFIESSINTEKNI